MATNPWAEPTYFNPFDTTPSSEVPLGPTGPLSPAASNRDLAVQRSANVLSDREKLMALLKQQYDTTAQQRQAADEYANQPARTDLSPLLGLVDAFTGSKLTGSYARPLSSDDKKLAVAKLRDLASDNQQKLTETQLKLLAGETKSEDALMKNIARVMGGGMTAMGQFNSQMKKEDRIEDYVKKTEEDFGKRKEQLDSIYTGLQEGSRQSVNTVLSQYARAVSGEKGVLTENDIYRVIPKTLQGQIADWKAYFSKNPGAVYLPPQFADGLKKMTKWAQYYAAKRFQGDLEAKRERASSRPTLKEMMKPGMTGDISFKSIEDRVNEMVPVADTALIKPEEVDEHNWIVMSEPERAAAIKASALGLLPKKKGKK